MSSAHRVQGMPGGVMCPKTWIQSLVRVTTSNRFGAEVLVPDDLTRTRLSPLFEGTRALGVEAQGHAWVDSASKGTTHWCDHSIGKSWFGSPSVRRAESTWGVVCIISHRAAPPHAANSGLKVRSSMAVSAARYNDHCHRMMVLLSIWSQKKCCCCHSKRCLPYPAPKIC